MREVSSWEGKRNLEKKGEKGWRPGVKGRLGHAEVEKEVKGPGNQKTHTATQGEEGDGLGGWGGDSVVAGREGQQGLQERGGLQQTEVDVT